MPDFRFRLPPIGNLTFSQRIAYSDRENSLLITGGPGSGKTVVSIYRYQRQMTVDKNAMFFTHHRTLIASIRGTFRQQADLLMPGMSERDVNRLLYRTVSSITEWYRRQFGSYLPGEDDADIIAKLKSIEKEDVYNYEELFIDEAQDLKPVVLNGVIALASRITCGADRAQDLNGHYIEPADEFIEHLLVENGREVTRQGLTQNFRNTKKIFEFARKFVPEDIGVQQIDVADMEEGDAPELYLRTREEQLELIVQIINDNPNSNIGILVHAYWQIDIIKKHLETLEFSCEEDAEEGKSFSYYYVHPSMDRNHRDIMENKLRTPFIITFDSCKGLEFDIVIMPLFENSDWSMTHSKTNGQTGEVDTFANGDIKYYASRNHYYVACTRARGLLYIMYTQKPAILDFYDEAAEKNVLDDLPF